MKFDFNQALQFIAKWVGVGIVLHFGFKLGEIIDGVLTFI